MNKEQFVKAMTYLAIAYDKEFNQEQLNVWYEFFKNDDFNVLRQAIKSVILKSKYLPSIAELKEEINYINNPQLKISADDEWLKIEDAIREYGIYNSEDALSNMSTLTKKAIRMLGGWDTICMSQEGDWLRKNFISIYNSLNNDVKEQCLLENKKLIGEKND